MARSTKMAAAVFAILLSVGTAAEAGDSPADIKQRLGAGDPAAGKEKSAMCQGCHGATGNSEAPTFPKLAGQYADYLRKQILDFQSGARVDPTMTGMAAALTDTQDMMDISAFFASQKQMKGAGGGNDAGKTLYLAGDGARGIYACVNCHGEDGKGKSPDNALFPVIGGQHADYLVKQLADLKSGTRKNDPAGMMADIAKKLTEGEIKALADYLARR